MNIFFRIFRRKPADPVQAAISQVRRQLRHRVSSTVLALAEARIRLRIVQGVPPGNATKAVIAWATSADHAPWTR
jgi:hypothetical protein